MNTKISIRFFNDREVRAAWDESSCQFCNTIMEML